MPLLQELENLFGFIPQSFRAHGAAGNKFNSTNCLSRRRGSALQQIARLIQKTTLQTANW